MKIVIADDDPINRKYLRALLTHEGHTTIECEDGAATLAYLEQNPCDAVISDILMPRMDGFRLCYEIRKNKTLNNTPVILYTATYLSAADEKAALAMGADRFLRKPAVSEVIVDTLMDPLACRNLDTAVWKSRFATAPAGRTRQVLENRTLLIVRNVLTDPNTRDPAVYRRLGVVSSVAVPLIVEDEALGILNLYTRQEHDFTDEEIEFLLTLSDQAAIAIHNTRLYQDNERRCHEAEELARIGRSLTETLDMKAIGERVVNNVLALFGVQGATLRLRQLDGSMIGFATVGTAFSQLSNGAVLPPEIGLASRAFAVGKPVWSADILHDANTLVSKEMREHIRDSGNGSIITVPLRAHEIPLLAKLLGILGFYTRTAHEFTQDETDFLLTLAGQAAIAIQNAQLYDDSSVAKNELEATNRSLDRSLKQLDSLYTALSPIATSESAEELMSSITDRLMEATGADAALIRLQGNQAGNLPIVAHRGFSSAALARAAEAPPGGSAAWVIHHGEPIIAPDITAERRLSGKFQLQLGLRSCAVLPIGSRGAVRGILHIASRVLGRFDEEQKTHLMAIARQLSIAMENHKLFEEVRASRDELAQAMLHYRKATANFRRCTPSPRRRANRRTSRASWTGRLRKSPRSSASQSSESIFMMRKRCRLRGAQPATKIPSS